MFPVDEVPVVEVPGSTAKSVQPYYVLTTNVAIGLAVYVLNARLW